MNAVERSVSFAAVGTGSSKERDAVDRGVARSDQVLLDPLAFRDHGLDFSRAQRVIKVDKAVVSEKRTLFGGCWG